MGKIETGTLMKKSRQDNRINCEGVTSMKMAGRIALTVLCSLAFLTRGGGADLNVTELQELFQNPPDDSRVMMRWWWFGPAVTKTELEREMRLMKEGGIGGFEVQPVYPLALDDAAAGIRTLPFLSDEFLEALRFTSEKARELGLRMDLTLGSGWPYGGPQVPIADAAGRLRVVRARVLENSRRIPVPVIGSGEKLITAFLCRTQNRQVVPDGISEISAISDGAVQLPAGVDATHEVLFFISGRTGMMVKRAAVGAEGFVLNHYDRNAVENYLKNVGDRLMQAFPEGGPYAIFCDSLEVNQSDWTGDFLDEFRTRRGYDLKRHLPALAFDLGPQTAAMRQDWGRTLTELYNERFLVPMQDWARRNRTVLRIQSYGIPPAILSSNALADLPEGEGSEWRTLCGSRWTASANHAYGRPVTSSETWTWLHSPSFRATPLDVKAEADLHFLQGINQLIGHGWPYTAEGIEYPGWCLYAAGVFNEKNPWWIVMPDVARYLQRVSFLLRQGQPANDVALYLPNSDAWAGFSPGRADMMNALRERIGPDVLGAVLDAGFNLDFLDDEVLKQIGRVDKGVLTLGACRYKAVVLPNVERIPLDTLKTLEQFVRSGGALFASRRIPDAAPGFMATEAEKSQIRELSRRLFEGPSAPAHFAKDEKIQLTGMMRSLLRPDLTLSPAGLEIGFIHRSASDLDIYFLANTSNLRQSVKATFRVTAAPAELWDPFSGRVSAADATPGAEGSPTVSLDFEPYGSRVLIFSKRSLPHPSAERAAAIPAPIDLSGGWQVTFGQGGRPIAMEHLRSWTEDESTRFFSGVAAYENKVTVPDAMLGPGLGVRLDFGEGRPSRVSAGKTNGMQAWLDAPIREAAVVEVNGKRAGSVWCPPYSVPLASLLKAGENQLRIVVGNLAVNHMAGEPKRDSRLLNLRYGVRFEPQDMDQVKTVTAGLLGPIRLTAGAPRH